MALSSAGQTGSGKTYTMGSAWSPEEDNQGVIPEVMDELFSRVESEPNTDFAIKVSFVEIHKVHTTCSGCWAAASLCPLTVSAAPAAGSAMAFGQQHSNRWSPAHRQ